MNSQLDLLNYICLPSVSAGLKLPDNTVYGRETHSIGGVFDYATAPDANGNIKVWRLKSGAGGPGWDMKLVTANSVSDALTEYQPSTAAPNTPLNPKNFKIHNAGKGFLLSNRFLSATQENLEIIPLDPSQTSFDIYLNGKKNQTSNLGPCTQYVQGPYTIDHGGNVGSRPTFIHHWQWSATSIERNFWAFNAGWVGWALFNRKDVNSPWSISQQTAHNVIAPAIVPALNFPAGKLTVVNGAIQLS